MSSISLKKAEASAANQGDTDWKYTTERMCQFRTTTAELVFGTYLIQKARMNLFSRKHLPVQSFEQLSAALKLHPVGNYHSYYDHCCI